MKSIKELMFVFALSLSGQQAYESFYLGNSVTVAHGVSRVIILAALLGTYHVIRRYFTTKE
ncbi:hypothetical protein [Alteromonas gracilis]|uniref:hypothetical protein n=1 Tax=Alteromonas gracilis TaxID=1479524 RepID=UPI0037368FCF